MTTMHLGADPGFEAAAKNRQSAYACAALGWLIVPWRPRLDGGKIQKVPTRRGWTQAGALRGVAEVSEWWVNSPNDIPGVVTGSESGVWVLDIDPRNGGTDSLARLDQVGALGTTFRVTTPQGGWHLYFTWPAGWEPGSIGSRELPGYPGLDIKGAGGFAAAPGAIVQIGDFHGSYQAPIGPSRILNAPDWLLETVRGGTSRGWSGADGGDWSAQDGTQEGDATWLNSELTRLRQIPPGSQHTEFIRFVFQMRVRGMRMVDALEAASKACAAFVPAEGRGPWTDHDALDEVKRTWQRVAPSSVDAQLKGWAEQQAAAPVALPAPPSTNGDGQKPDAQPLPPPAASARVNGEPPRAIGPDDENAQDLKDFAGEQLMWIAAGDWLFWNGVRWERDDALARHEIVRELGRSLVARAGSGECNEDERNWLIKRYQRLGTVGGRDTCLNYGRDLFAVAASALDADPWALNTPGGLVDLRSGTVRPSTPKDLVTQITKWAVREDSQDDVWDRVLAERV
ncbi:MAG: bifunctional DNA primase/polymerase, partial [Actinobacteria bacterium]|nr:bifunctional DNA primase/polymerase [Actinomycetota bacterium]